MNEIKTDKLLEIGIALSREKDDDRLLGLILHEAMEMTACDGGTLYIYDGESLRFHIMITKSMNTYKGGKNDPVDLPPVPMRRSHVCACAAMEKKLINIPDVYEHTEEYDFSGPKNYDKMTGYRTKSMLVVPMEDEYGDVIGVLQLINAKDETGETIPFEAGYEKVISSLASQAAICLTNMKHSREIMELLDSFVRVMSTAIDARTPYNANHTKNMVRYGGKFLQYLRDIGHEWQMDEQQEKEFLMSVWLHDIGKLVIPLGVMDKETRLGNRLSEVEHRFEKMKLLKELSHAKGEITAEELETELTLLSEGRETILKANRAGFLPDETMEQVQEVANRTFTDTDGSKRTWLTGEELTCMMIRKGTLSDAERRIMQSHVEMTEKFLNEVHFPKRFSNVTRWASSHHELLNGKGYPRNLAKDDIEKEVRLLSILDIFDALTARDRPYKPPMPVEKALFVLQDMVKFGELDRDILTLFANSKAWEE
ncbi:MAG: GAF domain-containing protein [Anaerotignum sp.]|nr:GAF domain-containing protein [Anaerotignum sp.]MBQ7103356.1 GAF domain-containing protein [Anaerotignum sp.]